MPRATIPARRPLLSGGAGGPRLVVRTSAGAPPGSGGGRRGSRTPAAELDVCVRRHGEGLLDYDGAPTVRFLAELEYLRARILEGLKRPEAVAAYEAFIASQEDGGDDVVLSDARSRVKTLKAVAALP